MRLGTLVTGIDGQTQILVDLAVVVVFALAIFVIAFLLGLWCGRIRRRR
jgi:predicted permease